MTTCLCWSHRCSVTAQAGRFRWRCRWLSTQGLDSHHDGQGYAQMERGAR